MLRKDSRRHTPERHTDLFLLIRAFGAISRDCQSNLELATAEERQNRKLSWTIVLKCCRSDAGGQCRLMVFSDNEGKFEMIKACDTCMEPIEETEPMTTNQSSAPVNSASPMDTSPPTPAPARPCPGEVNRDNQRQSSDNPGNRVATQTAAPAAGSTATVHLLTHATAPNTGSFAPSWVPPANPRGEDVPITKEMATFVFLAIDYYRWPGYQQQGVIPRGRDGKGKNDFHTLSLLLPFYTSKDWKMPPHSDNPDRHVFNVPFGTKIDTHNCYVWINLSMVIDNLCTYYQIKSGAIQGWGWIPPKCFVAVTPIDQSRGFCYYWRKDDKDPIYPQRKAPWWGADCNYVSPKQRELGWLRPRSHPVNLTPNQDPPAPTIAAAPAAEEPRQPSVNSDHSSGKHKREPDQAHIGASRSETAHCRRCTKKNQSTEIPTNYEACAVCCLKIIQNPQNKFNKGFNRYNCRQTIKLHMENNAENSDEEETRSNKIRTRKKNLDKAMLDDLECRATELYQYNVKAHGWNSLKERCCRDPSLDKSCGPETDGRCMVLHPQLWGIVDLIATKTHPWTDSELHLWSDIRVRLTQGDEWGDDFMHNFPLILEEWIGNYNRHAYEGAPAHCVLYGCPASDGEEEKPQTPPPPPPCDNLTDKSDSEDTAEIGDRVIGIQVLTSEFEIIRRIVTDNLGPISECAHRR